MTGDRSFRQRRREGYAEAMQHRQGEKKKNKGFRKVNEPLWGGESSFAYREMLPENRHPEAYKDGAKKDGTKRLIGVRMMGRHKDRATRKSFPSARRLAEKNPRFGRQRSGRFTVGSFEGTREGEKAKAHRRRPSSPGETGHSRFRKLRAEHAIIGGGGSKTI